MEWFNPCGVSGGEHELRGQIACTKQGIVLLFFSQVSNTWQTRHALAFQNFANANQQRQKHLWPTRQKLPIHL